MSAPVLLAVLAAGALGALARFGVTKLFARPNARLPWAVLVVNVLGALLGGVLLGLAQGDAVDPAVRSILFGGFAGGFTTFSTFSVETIQLVQEGRLRAAAASVGANLVLGIAAAAAGFGLGLLLG